MPRSLVLAALLCFPVSLAAQSDSTPPATTAPDTTYLFHKGQWAAQFEAAGGFYGAGALLFTSPDAAWLVDGSVDFGYAERTDFDASQTQGRVQIVVGRRWYRAPVGRVRAFGGVGLLGSWQTNSEESSGNEGSSKSYALGAQGELGASVFLTPEISLGASWRAVVSGNYYSYKTNGVYQSKAQGVSFSAGDLAILGAFYF